jgi:hypothetical protein
MMHNAACPLDEFRTPEHACGEPARSKLVERDGPVEGRAMLPFGVVGPILAFNQGEGSEKAVRDAYMMQYGWLFERCATY